MFNVIILGLASFLGDVASEMIYPLLPLYLTAALGAGPAILGLIEGVAESIASLLKVSSGTLSDRLGRRKPLAIGGYAGSAIGKALLAFSTSWPWVFWARTVDRFGKGIRTAPRDALIAESTDPAIRGRAFGLHRTMDTLGAVVGIVLAYILMTGERLTYRTIFLVAVIPAAMSALMVAFARETPTKPAAPLRDLAIEWRQLDPRIRLFLGIAVLFTLGNSSNAFLLLRADDLGLDAGRVILLYLLYNVIYAAASYPAGSLSDRIGRKRLLIAGYLCYGLVYYGMAWHTSPGRLWFLFGLYGLYSGLTEGVEKALLADFAPKDRRGTVLGLHATLVGVTLFPASLIAGFLWSLLGSAAPFFFGGFTALLSALTLALLL